MSKDKIKNKDDSPLINCTEELSHVERTILSMNEEDLLATKKELLKDAKIIKTEFGDIVIFHF